MKKLAVPVNRRCEMPMYDDVMKVEGVEGYEAVDEADYFKAMQRQINAGLWSLQGSHGRAMMDAIASGHCMLGQQPARDYWGNYIPSREQVEAGTKGSKEFVAEHMGDEWADAMEAI